MTARSEVFVTVTKNVPEEQQDTWLAMAEEMVAKTRIEDGCKFYCFTKSHEVAKRFVIVEEWASMPQLEAHFATEHFTRLVPKMDAISSTPCLDVCQDNALMNIPLGSRLPRITAPLNVPYTDTHVIVTKDVEPEKQGRWLEYAEEMVTETRKEAGCKFYSVVKSKDVATRFVIIEEWETTSHLHAHFDTDHFKRLVPKMDAISNTAVLDVCTDKVCIPVPVCSRVHRQGRVLVLYDSCSTCTERMSEYVAQGATLSGLCDVRVRMVPMGPDGRQNHWDAYPEAAHRVHGEPTVVTFEDVYWADGIAAGTPTNLGCVSWRTKYFWDSFSQGGGFGRIDGKIGCSFSSQGGHGGGAELVCMAMNTILMNFGMSVFGVTDYVGFMNTLHYGAVVGKAPRDELDKMACRRLGLRLSEYVSLYILGSKASAPLIGTKAVDEARWGYPGIPAKQATMSQLQTHEEEVIRHSKMVAAMHTINSPPPLMARKALIFTKMADYVHGSTAAQASWVQQTCRELGMYGVVSDDSSLLEKTDDGEYQEFDLIILVNNSGVIFDVNKEALSAHVAAGRGVVGVHAALACFLDGEDASGHTIMGPTCSIIQDIFGAHFKNHPDVCEATVHIDYEAAKTFPGLPNFTAFKHTDEFFNFTCNPADDKSVTVVATVDESTYEGGLMGPIHPVAWHRHVGERHAPVFYSALGHYSHFYNGMGPSYVADILRAGIDWCSKPEHHPQSPPPVQWLDHSASTTSSR